jgi:hypothetical protein
MISFESVLASMTLGYCIGFGYLTAWDAFKLTRQARNPSRNLFAWMVWSEIVACMAMSVAAWLILHGLIKATYVIAAQNCPTCSQLIDIMITV